LRYLIRLDPTRMAFLVDFCEKLNFELVENNLYFVQPETNDQTVNNVSVVEAAEDFAEKILPTLQRMTNPVDTVNSNEDSGQAAVNQ
jgi:hypothetical protein